MSATIAILDLDPRSALELLFRKFRIGNTEGWVVLFTSEPHAEREANLEVVSRLWKPCIKARGNYLKEHTSPNEE